MQPTSPKNDGGYTSLKLAGIAQSSRSLYPDLYQHCDRTLVRPLRSCSKVSDVWAKDETLNPSGTFKIRSASGALAVYRKSLQEVVVLSSGNFGVALAYLAQSLHTQISVVVPRSCPARKRELLTAFGATVLEASADGYVGAKQLAARLCEERGLNPVSSYDPPSVLGLAGVSIMDEILNEELPFQRIYAPCGGGGLLVGLAAALRKNSRCKVIGVESEGSPAMKMSFQASRAVTRIPYQETLSDATEGGVDALSYELLREFPHLSLLTVSEAEIQAAVEILEAELGHPVEGAGALALAGHLHEQPQVGSSCVLVTGRNV